MEFIVNSFKTNNYYDIRLKKIPTSYLIINEDLIEY